MQEDQALWRQFIRGEPTGFEKSTVPICSQCVTSCGCTWWIAPLLTTSLRKRFCNCGSARTSLIPRNPIRAYLFGIARNKAADWWRQQAILNAVAPETSYRVDSTVLITDALQHLEPDLRNILWLREIEGYSYSELAGILDIPLGTVRSRLFTAREQLRRVWQTTSEE